ncbi:MAG: NHL repeat-containing protein [Deltaproteobacteria bacterium]
MSSAVFTPASYAGSIRLLAVISGGAEFGGRLKEPSGLFFDEGKKRLYIADSGNRRIVSLDEDFKYLAELGSKDIELPVSVVKNDNGQFISVDAGRGEIHLIETKKESQIEPFKLMGGEAGTDIFVPGRIAIDGRNRLYVIDRLNKRIIVADGNGAVLRSIAVKDEGFYGFNDVRADDEGNVYALDTIGGKVYIFDGSGNLTAKFSGKDSAGKPIFKFPVSLAADKKYIYVADVHAGTVFVFDKTGVLHHRIGKKGEREGEFSHPTYVFVDASERIFVIDGNRVQVLKEEKE